MCHTRTKSNLAAPFIITNTKGDGIQPLLKNNYSKPYASQRATTPKNKNTDNPYGKLFKQFQSVCVCSPLIFSFISYQRFEMAGYRAISPLRFEKQCSISIPFSFTQPFKFPAAFNSFKDRRNRFFFRSSMPVKLHSSSEITPVNS